MRNYQLDQLMLNPDAPIPDNVRVIKDDDIIRFIYISKNLIEEISHFFLIIFLL